MTRTPTLADVVAAVESLYPPAWASPNDPVGLVVGDPTSAVARVHFAVDPVEVVVAEAVRAGADMLIVHHPLLFRAVHSVAATTAKGRVVHNLVSHNVALYTAHTNADSPPSGVSESLALAFGLTDLQPLDPEPADALDKLVTFVPPEDTQKVIDALAAAGAGSIGEYDRCAFVAVGRGTFRPGGAANPTIGRSGDVEVVAEQRVEMVLPRRLRGDVVDALRRVHPYEEPAFDVHELAGLSADRGTGRVGRLVEPMSLREFADRVTAALPPTAIGARVAGDLDRQVNSVAVVGGSGDFMLDTARAAGVDVYVTSDLRHHPASEATQEPSAPALVDVSHWAAEWTWLPVAERRLRDSLAAAGFSVQTSVSRLCTDPWNHRAGAAGAGAN